MRRHGLPCPEVSVTDALFAVSGIVQDVVGDREQIAPVFLPGLADRLFIALPVQVDDFFIDHAHLHLPFTLYPDNVHHRLRFIWQKGRKLLISVLLSIIF